jgi:fermentation-respiration switch protein FrsA (DUF1100 family)
MSWWVTVSLVVLLALAVLRWLVRVYEPSLAFFPLRGEDATPASYGVPYTRESITTADGERLRAWHLARADALAEVVYFHGNGGNLSMWCDVIVGLWRAGYDVLAFDYRGYGASSGSPSEAGLYRDGEAVIARVHERRGTSGRPLIYWGRSLGTTMAAHAATVRPPNGIILEAGFPSMRAVVRSNPVLWVLSWFSSYEFPTARWMSSAHPPVLVLHGDADEVIPFALGRELYAQLPGAKSFFTVTAGNHNDATPRNAKAYWDTIARFVAELK